MSQAIHDYVIAHLPGHRCNLCALCKQKSPCGNAGAFGLNVLCYKLFVKIIHQSCNIRSADPDGRLF